MSRIDRIKELVETLNYHRNLYYNESCSEISDFEYDQLFYELSKLEKETGIVMSTSPTVTVGYEVKSSLNKVKHNHPMLSLDKTKSVDDVIKFLNGRDGVVMAKMDGLTCSIRYINGELVSAETRGDGEIGEDILHCAKTITNLPLKIECLDEVIIDGEVIITYDDFEKINSTLPTELRYKHPRNLASGSIRHLDSNVAAERNMKFIAWKMIKGSDDNSFLNRLRLMQDIGFKVVPFYAVVNERLDERINKIIEHIKRESQFNNFPIDGCVFGYDDIAYGDSLGATGHHLRSQLAFKFYDEVYDTTLLYIDWTMGKTGILTPTAVFNPVEIDGTIVERASLSNLSIMRDTLGTPFVGEEIFVSKRNMVIPKVENAYKLLFPPENNIIEIPSVCPICGGATAIQKDNDSEVLICTNPNCSGKLLGRFVHFVSKKGMDIEGLSEATLDLLISNGYITKFKDIYYLFSHQNELVNLPGLGEKSVEKLLQSIEKSRNVKMENYLCALGIPNCGLSAAKILSNKFNGDYDEFIQAILAGFDLTSLEGFGDVIKNSILTWIRSSGLDDELAEEMNFIIPEQRNDTSLDGLKFSITGSFSQPRDELKKKLEAKGAKFISSVSKNLDILFAGEKAGSKLTKAQSLRVKVADEAELLRMIGE